MGRACDVGFGSFASFRLSAGHFWSSPNCGHSQRPSVFLKSAISDIRIMAQRPLRCFKRASSYWFNRVRLRLLFLRCDNRINNFLLTQRCFSATVRLWFNTCLFDKNAKWATSLRCLEAQTRTNMNESVSAGAGMATTDQIDIRSHTASFLATLASSISRPRC